MSRKFMDMNRPGLGFDQFRERSRSPHKDVEKNCEKTIMVQNIHPNTTSKDLESFFSAVGKVKNIRWPSIKNVVFVEFEKVENVTAALKCSGSMLMGRRIEIIPRMLKKNSNESFPEPIQKRTPFGRLYIGNLHFKVNKIQIKELFEPFGKLEFVKLVEDDAGKSRGFAFVKYYNPEHATAALQALDGIPLQGRNIKVTNQDSSVNSQNFEMILKENESMESKYNIEFNGNKNFSSNKFVPSFTSNKKNIDNTNSKSDQLNRNNSIKPLFGIDKIPSYNKELRSTHSDNKSTNSNQNHYQRYEGNYLDDKYLSLKNQVNYKQNFNEKRSEEYPQKYEHSSWESGASQNSSRYQTKQENYSMAFKNEVHDNSESYYNDKETRPTNTIKNSENLCNDVFSGEVTTHKNANMFPGTPSQCLMATNMFDPNDQNSDDWASELCDDVIDEVAKYKGALLHIFVDQAATEGNVYLKACNLEDAWCVVRALHGRYFDGRQVKVESIPLTLYHKLFPKSINATDPIVPPSAEKVEKTQLIQSESLKQQSDGLLALPPNLNNPPPLLNYQLAPPGIGILQQQVATWNNVSHIVSPNLNVGYNNSSVLSFSAPFQNLGFQRFNNNLNFGQGLQFGQNY